MLRVVKPGKLKAPQMKPLEFLGSSRDDLAGMPAGVRDVAGAFPALYVAKFEAAVDVLHAFQKKTPQTAKAETELARVRYRMIGGKP